MNFKSKTYRSNGKLLLSGEYVVLDGAKALAIPTKYGQSLTVEENDTYSIIWRSYDDKGELWFKDEFTLEEIATSQNIEIRNDISNRLIQIIKAAQDLNPEFLNSNQGYNIATHLDFNRKWGLGTSSTLINNVANWAKINAYQLLNKTFGGSGYDIACAEHNTPITYQLKQPESPLIEPITFNPVFKNQLYFVYLNQKQNSRDGIKAYKALNKVSHATIESINGITDAMINCSSLDSFERLITTHESIIADLINQPTITSKLFNDYHLGEIKSLGAWGGDFVLATSKTDPSGYFKSKGLDVVIPYTEMVL
ncbi:GYDIA family GHMP kinase [Winogradskyella sp.]|uniref:GYDIA family GHMP kinase n=1 Tax=Winogradskyella sp. TaxID=1883156 RepID=UPI0025F672C0|nr:GYDIA family GHMP kinase [Winogradskyella sp.]MCT4629937.1 GYDIA family GHMP kinase [Winogradskyella sp.]